MADRKMLLWGWWLAVLLGFGSYTVMTLREADQKSPTVVRVVGNGAEFWAYTQERSILQGVESAWWVSFDGGMTWAGGEPPRAVVDAESVEETCGEAACFRLVDGVRIERRDAASSTWHLEHERPSTDAPPARGEGRRDWEAERSIAVAEGSTFESAAVSAGKDGALVRSSDETWRRESVGRSWMHGVRWWLVGIGGAGALIGGAVVDQIIRRVQPVRSGGSMAHRPESPGGPQ